MDIDDDVVAEMSTPVEKVRTTPDHLTAVNELLEEGSLSETESDDIEVVTSGPPAPVEEPEPADPVVYVAAKSGYANPVVPVRGPNAANLRAATLMTKLSQCGEGYSFPLRFLPLESEYEDNNTHYRIYLKLGRKKSPIEFFTVFRVLDLFSLDLESILNRYLVG